LENHPWNHSGEKAYQERLGDYGITQTIPLVGQ
jgi:hypothetical protein